MKRYRMVNESPPPSEEEVYRELNTGEGLFEYWTHIIDVVNTIWYAGGEVPESWNDFRAKVARYVATGEVK